MIPDCECVTTIAPPSFSTSAARFSGVQVLAGEIYLSETMTRQMLHRIADTPSAKGVSPVERLSDRELEVFERLGQGRKTKEIAHDLHLSIKTVQTYCEHLKEKLQLKDGTSLVRFAVQWVEAQT